MVVQQQNAANGKVEGLEDRERLLWGDYPLDSFLVRNETRTIHEVLRRIDQDLFVMDPDFQRDFIWATGKQSRLIESVLMRIPLPVFYLAEDGLGRMIVVDGLQRLTTFQRFANNELRLRLSDRPELNKKKFSDLPPKLQNRFEDCVLTLYVLDERAPERARLDIFERVNGGVALSRQQMRNCLYMGDATRFLKQEASTPAFLDATGGSLNPRLMRDREFINRFCAFHVVGFEEYKGMDEFLAEALQRMNAQPEILTNLSLQFRTSMRNNVMVFGGNAFRKPASEGQSSMINAALWDVMSTGLAPYSPDIVEEKAELLKIAFYRLMADEDFQYAITYSTNQVKSVKFRFEVARSMFSMVFDA